MQKEPNLSSLARQQRLLKILQRRLQGLEDKAAQYGINCPVEIEMEIEDTREKITNFEERLTKKIVPLGIENDAVIQEIGFDLDGIATKLRKIQDDQQWTMEIFGLTIWKARWIRIVTLLVTLVACSGLWYWEELGKGNGIVSPTPNKSLTEIASNDFTPIAITQITLSPPTSASTALATEITTVASQTAYPIDYPIAIAQAEATSVVAAQIAQQAGQTATSYTNDGSVAIILPPSEFQSTATVLLVTAQAASTNAAEAQATLVEIKIKATQAVVTAVTTTEQERNIQGPNSRVQVTSVPTSTIQTTTPDVPTEVTPISSSPTPDVPAEVTSITPSPTPDVPTEVTPISSSPTPDVSNEVTPILPSSTPDTANQVIPIELSSTPEVSIHTSTP